jgi:hypothetical protein
MFDSGACADVAFAARTGDAPGSGRGAIDELRSGAVDGNRMAARAYRSPRLVAVLLAVVCTSACHSTAVNRLNVRAEPTTASRVISNLNSAGTSVIVDCFVHGEAIHGNTIWYRIAQPQPGYVSGYYVRADGGDAAAPSC